MSQLICFFFWKFHCQFSPGFAYSYLSFNLLFFSFVTYFQMNLFIALQSGLFMDSWKYRTTIYSCLISQGLFYFWKCHCIFCTYFDLGSKTCYCFIPSRVSSRGYKIGPICIYQCVSLLVSALTAEPSHVGTQNMVQSLTLTISLEMFEAES